MLSLYFRLKCHTLSSLNNNISQNSIIFHIGLPKCGSTAIQSKLFEQQTYLRSKGIYYPLDHIITDQYGPNHRFLTEILKTNSNEAEAIVQSILDVAIQSSCTTTILSHEGLTNHFVDIRDHFFALLASVNKTHTIKILLVYRPLKHFFYAYYKQNIVNPPTNDSLGYGSQLMPIEFFTLPRVQQLLRVGTMMSDLLYNCPFAELNVLPYGATTLLDGLNAYLGIDLPAGTFRKNVSLSDGSTEHIRSQNHLYFDNLPQREKWINALKLRPEGDASFHYNDPILDLTLDLFDQENREILGSFFLS